MKTNSLLESFIAKLVIVLTVILTFGVMASALNYQTSDPDSQFYVFLTRQQALRDSSELMAPYWLGQQNIRPDEYVRDHLIGQIALGYGFAQLGFPPETSLYVACALFSLLSYLLIHAILRHWLSSEDALLATLLTLILPISFLYRVRANHELPLLFFCLLVVWGGLSIRSLARYTALVVLSTAGVFLVKGFVFVVIPMLAVLTLLLNGTLTLKRWIARSLVVGLVSVAVTGAVGVAYEAAFRQVTGQSFFHDYFTIQFLNRSVRHTAGDYPFILKRVWAMGYYLVQSLWYGVPLTVVGGYVFFGKGQRGPVGRGQKSARVFALWTHCRSFLRSEVPLCSGLPSAMQGFVLLLVLALSYIALMALSDRVSGRYVFPAFYLIPMGIAVQLASMGKLEFWRNKKSLSRILGYGSVRPTLVISMVFLLLTSLHLFTTNKGTLIPFPEELPFEPILNVPKSQDTD